jgi:hypothetical protein
MVNHLVGFGARRASGGSPGGFITPSYWHSLSRGGRTASITVSTTATLGQGTIDNLVDGGFGANSTDACWFNNGQTLRSVTFDFGTAYIIDGFRWFQDNTTGHGTWTFEGSNDNSSYTSIGSITLVAATFGEVSSYIFSNTTAYRYYRLRQTAGSTSSSPWLEEIEFRVGDASGSNRDAVEQGDRTSLITVTTTATPSSGTNVTNLIDGAYGTNSSDSFAFSTESTREIKFDFGSGVTKILTGLQWLQSSTNNHGTWVFEGSNDDSTYTGLGSSFALGGATVTAFTFTNSTAYRYYKLRQTSGTTSSSPWLIEIEFRVG